MNAEALLELASDPRLIPHLLERVRKATQGQVELAALDGFLPALARAREVVGGDHYDASGERLEVDNSLLDEINAAERALLQAL